MTAFFRSGVGFVRKTVRLNRGKLIAAYLLLALLMIAASYQIVTPSYFYDECLYAKMARSMVRLDAVAFADTSMTYPPLYPLLISPAFLFHDMAVTYSAIKIINSITLSTMVFLSWLLLG